MLTLTSEMAIRSLLHIARNSNGQYLSLQHIAEHFAGSQAYLSKVISQLSRAAILRSQRGSTGGVMLARDPAEITLLQIVQASQGQITPSYCHGGIPTGGSPCSYHLVMYNFHKAMTEYLEGVTLADMMKDPFGNVEGKAHIHCKMLPDKELIQSAHVQTP